MEVFNKEYDGESLCDLSRDLHEALDGQYNDIVNQIPADEYGFNQGVFTVSIEWKPNSGNSLQTKMKTWKRFCCWIGWHSHPRFETTGFDGASVHAKCRWCGYVGLVDSQGNLF